MTLNRALEILEYEASDWFYPNMKLFLKNLWKDNYQKIFYFPGSSTCVDPPQCSIKKLGMVGVSKFLLEVYDREEPYPLFDILLSCPDYTQKMFWQAMIEFRKTLTND